MEQTLVADGVKSQAEIWKTAPGWNVEVSNLGSVRDLIGKKPRRISYCNGYPYIGIGSGRASSVHRLIALAFLGPCPNLYEVDHINGNRQDNRVENLRYVTPSENINGSVGRGHRGEKRWNSVLTEEKVKEIRKLKTEGKTGCAIAKIIGLHQSTVYHVLRGENWKHIA